MLKQCGTLQAWLCSFHPLQLTLPPLCFCVWVAWTKQNVAQSEVWCSDAVNSSAFLSQSSTETRVERQIWLTPTGSVEQRTVYIFKGVTPAGKRGRGNKKWSASSRTARHACKGKMSEKFNRVGHWERVNHSHSAWSQQWLTAPIPRDYTEKNITTHL